MINLTARGKAVVDSGTPERRFRDKERAARTEHSITTVDPWLHYLTHQDNILAYEAYVDAKTAADDLYLVRMDKAWEEFKIEAGPQGGRLTSPDKAIRRANSVIQRKA